MKNLIVMGVSGCGKSTFAAALAEAIGAVLVEGDELHPSENVEKMSSGFPLNDEDRQGWLEQIRDVISVPSEVHRVVTCSALKRKYRDVLKEGDPNLMVIHLTAPRKVLEERMRSRDHFMPPSLLESQLADLEVPKRALEVSSVMRVEDMVAQVREGLGV